MLLAVHYRVMEHISSYFQRRNYKAARATLALGYIYTIYMYTILEEFESGGPTVKTYQMFSVHTKPEEFENGGFTLKTYQMFSVHTKPEEFENRGFTLKTYQIISVHTTLRNLKTQQ